MSRRYLLLTARQVYEYGPTEADVLRRVYQACGPCDVYESPMKLGDDEPRLIGASESQSQNSDS